MLTPCSGSFVLGPLVPPHIQGTRCLCTCWHMHHVQPLHGAQPSLHPLPRAGPHATHLSSCTGLSPDAKQCSLPCSDPLGLQDSCGAELAMLLLQAFNEDGVPPDAAHTQPVLAILLSFPGRSSPRSTELTPDLCSRYALEALKWLRKPPPASAPPGQPQPKPQQAGDSGRVQTACEQIHLHLAVLITTFYGPPGLGWAGPHFALSHDPAAFAQAVAAAAGADPGPSEHLYIARAALQVGRLNPKS